MDPTDVRDPGKKASSSDSTPEILRFLGWLLAGALSLANTGEVFCVALQQWRGVPSHFNNSTPFDAAVFLAEKERLTPVGHSLREWV